ncbi:hypothetical protein DW074_14840 [Ruminococcus sp. AF46-10NS]|nr:hypothetical protein DW074_14840 [Ruminococcus sp. AF46-10NS]
MDQRSTEKKFRRVSCDFENFYAEEEEVNLTVTEHKKLIEHFDLEDRAERMERKYCFFLGQARMFSYGRMLAEIQDTVRKRDIDDEINDELLDYVMDGRIDDVEMGLQAENLEYREALTEVNLQENMIQAMGLTKPVKKQVDAYVSAVNRRWILYVEQAYKAGMKDLARLIGKR